MPLAGRMKLNTFITMIIATVAVLGAGSVIASSFFESDEPEPEPEPELIDNGTPTPTPTPTPTNDPPPLSETADAVVMSYVGKDLGSNKVKDARPGKPYKINLYQDDGNSTVNRAKVDLDRDDTWDEKWTISGDQIKKQIAPNDDENYTVEQVWNGSSWGGGAEEATPEATPDVATVGRPVDQFILGRVGQNLGTKKIKDATRGRPYKVNLYQDDGNASVNRAKVDLDRDDKWDEKWTISGDQISRQVAPNDDENYTIEQVWSDAGWQ
ncbi:MAG: hypothetical protein AAFV53_05255 [Myxococcota bacterium]